MRVRTLAARFLVAGLTGWLLVACAGGAPTPAPTTALVAPTEAAPSLPAATPTERPRLYPYVLAWPEEELESRWRYARTPWDGVERIDHGNQYTDSVSTRDGELFAFGYPTDETATELQARIATQAQEWHGCDAEPVEEEPLAGGGAEGILAVHDCGEQGVLRWIAVHNGFGLFIGMIVGTEIEPATVRKHFEDRIAGLTWTN